MTLHVPSVPSVANALVLNEITTHRAGEMINFPPLKFDKRYPRGVGYPEWGPVTAGANGALGNPMIAHRDETPEDC